MLEFFAIVVVTAIIVVMYCRINRLTDRNEKLHDRITDLSRQCELRMHETKEALNGERDAIERTKRAYAKIQIVESWMESSRELYRNLDLSFDDEALTSPTVKPLKRMFKP